VLHSEQIRACAKALKLAYIAVNGETAAADAKKSKLSHDEFLALILSSELEQRLNNGVMRRIREAHFPSKKLLENFDRTKYDLSFEVKFDERETLRFITNCENIILIGTPGAGKNHYATALGIAACTAGKSVLFTYVPNLVIELKEASDNRKYSSLRRKCASFDLVILDELGYISFGKNASELLFNFVSTRSAVGSVIITTNLNFNRWPEVFGDSTLTAALTARLAHKAHVLDISREKGGRLEDTLFWLQNSLS
jgi:DNA replication protein DnaC